MLSNLNKNEGVTLIELLVALTINIIIFVAMIGFFSSNLAHYNKEIKMDKLNQELETVMQLMTNDIRRAGYWANAKNDLGATQSTNPFTSTSNSTDINLPSSSCILFTYDHRKTGSLPSISTTDDDRYGFRLNNQILQIRPFGLSPFSCTGTWENMTDPNVVLITSLTFTLNSTTASSGSLSVVLRSVDISITGQLATDSTITKTLTQHVRIRNDKVMPHA